MEFIKLRIFIQCMIAPLCGYMNRDLEEPGCSFNKLDESLPIGYQTDLFDVFTCMFA